jgi:hypothetical protein
VRIYKTSQERFFATLFYSTTVFGIWFLKNILERIIFDIFSDTRRINLLKWKRINRKQIARWQHPFWLKASAFIFEFFC